MLFLVPAQIFFIHKVIQDAIQNAKMVIQNAIFAFIMHQVKVYVHEENLYMVKVLCLRAIKF